ncbi:hypothetical protein DERP_009497 [Dermatophagoides pteronyssinus]|uniref:Uncharacterized protein n=1 Tax=Dermatophagoides pteronyssinus TaxID=6956 RepID=A0ABQ8IU98_DERPT|nr:hypothetical protein DERP_009497 [Dermatophagoides pteronyssinus]
MTFFFHYYYEKRKRKDHQNITRCIWKLFTQRKTRRQQQHWSLNINTMGVIFYVYVRKKIKLNNLITINQSKYIRDSIVTITLY